MRDAGTPPARRDLTLWLLAFSLLGAALLARNLLGLATSPPGMYVDEASIGYNAWAIAHFGVDEHGARLPLYFQAFGEYKNPVYVYALVPLLRFLPLTPAVERLPAAIFGATAALFIALTAWRVSRSRAVALALLALAALTPWLTQESRVGFEVISMVATLCAAVWCLADESRLSQRRFALAGVLMALSIVAYSTGRLEVALFTLVFIYAYRGHRGWWLALVPVAAGYVVELTYALLHPGALTAEFNVISIAADGAPPSVLISRFIANYVQFFSPDFLLVHGDPNLRHNTGYAGMLLAATAPLLLAGLWVCWKRRRESLPRFTVLCLVLGPVSGALTLPSPHALRGAVMLPFIFVLCSLGATWVRDLVRGRAAVVAVLSAGVAAQGSLYLLDLYTAYPARAATAFDAGALPAVTAAAHAASGHTVYLSRSIDEQPYIDAFMALLPPPPQHHVDDSAGRGLALLHMVVTDATSAELTASRGDVIVLGAADPPPANAERIDVERAPAGPFAESAAGGPLLIVYRIL